MRALIRRNEVLIITFILAFTIMMGAFAVNQMYPFGDKQILVIDAWHQYYPFLSEFQDKLQSGGSLFYDHNIGLGVNFWLMSAYYTNSPLNFLSILWPSSLLTEFMMVMTAIKVALAATFMAALIRYLYKKSDIYVPIFGLLYAFSTFFMGYYWCIMWLDSVALLPLIVLGLHKVLRNENELLYIASLAIAIYANYYMGFMICLFIAFYYLYLVVVEYKTKSVREFLYQTVNVVFCSLIGVGISALVLIPVYKGMQLASSAKFYFPKNLVIERHFPEILTSMLPGTKPTVVDHNEMPNITTGTLGIIMLFLYFKTQRIRLSEKIASFAFIMFLLLGFMTNMLNLIWHGLHAPNGIPYRFAFLFVFFVITLAYRGFEYYNGAKSKVILSFMGLFILFILLNEGDMIQTHVAILSIVAMLFYACLIWSYYDGRIRRSVLALLLLILVVVESTASAIYGVAVTGFSKRSTYRLYEADVNSALAEMRRVDSGIYRTEMARLYSTNDSALYGYRGASTFSSTLNANVTRFVRKLGAMGDGPSNRYTIPMSSPILDSLYNIKYFIGRNELGEASFAGYTDLGKWNYVRLLRNENVLPLGFYVGVNAGFYDDSSENPFVVQEKLYGQFLDESNFHCYQYFEPQITYDRMNTTFDGDYRYNYSLSNNNAEGTATVKFEAPEDGDYYIYVFAPRSKPSENTIWRIANDSYENARKEYYEARRGIIVPTGTMKAGGWVEIEMPMESGGGGYFDLKIAKVDYNRFVVARNKLASNPFILEEFKDTYIKGSIIAPEAGDLFLSLPYERGWEARVNGVLVETRSVKSAMFLIPVLKGANTVELRYVPDGFKEGILLSGISIVVTIALLFGRKRYKIPFIKEKAASSEPAASMTV